MESPILKDKFHLEEAQSHAVLKLWNCILKQCLILFLFKKDQKQESLRETHLISNLKSLGKIKNHIFDLFFVKYLYGLLMAILVSKFSLIFEGFSFFLVNLGKE